MTDTSQGAAPADQNAHKASGKAAQWGIFAALVAFLPIPFIVPFWATATVPVSYLISSGGRVGKVGVAYGLVAALGLFIVARILNRVARLIPRQNVRNLVEIALVLMLAVLSLLPIYKPGLDPSRPGINIVKLFQQGIPVGQ